MSRRLVAAIAVVAAVTACNFNDQREPPDGQRVTGTSDGTPQPDPVERDATQPQPAPEDEAPRETPSASTDSETETGTGSGTATGSGTSTDTSTDPGVPAGPSFAEVESKVLEPYCTMCHAGADAAEAVDLSEHARLMAATAVVGDDNSGQPGAVIVPGNAERSILWQTVTSDRMPYFSDPLPDDAKALLRAWIQGGAMP